MYKTFPNLGYFQHQFDPAALAFLRKEIVEIQQEFDKHTKFNHNLAGNIEQEYLLVKSKKNLEAIILPLVAEYNQKCNVLASSNIMSRSLPLYLDAMWVNFQKKYEFNPSHNHEGIISFVIWIDIPYYFADEIIAAPGTGSNSHCPGHFELQYTSTMGQISNIRFISDKSMENTMLLFPSKMAHCVYPFFSSDKYRISVSGNFKLMVD